MMKLPFYYKLVVLLFIGSCVAADQQIEREILFNEDWRFLRSDNVSGQQMELDDSAWRLLGLPHDYSIEDLPDKVEGKIIGPFSEESVGGVSTGHVVGGSAWYRKHFTMDASDQGKIIEVLFDGIYMNADFWINGHYLGNHPYGYTAFAFDLTEHLNPAGENNVLAVKVKNEGKNSRWYSGSGIYRNVCLIKTNPVHFDLWGTFITTSAVVNKQATVQIKIGVANESQQEQKIKLRSQIINAHGEVEDQFESDIDLPLDGFSLVETRQLTNPQLWSPDHPALYKLRMQLTVDGHVIDDKTEKFGIRTIKVSSEKGFLLNDTSVLLKGACLHHDNGALGSAAFKSAEYRKVRIMKANGFNAIRTAHNPPSKVFLEACDELGMLVMDELFDQWQHPKNDEDYHLYFDQWWERDLTSMILRDRNHPSVVIWSIANEVYERADSSGLIIARNLKNKLLTMDDTRPVTQAISHFWDQPGRGWDDTAPAFAQMDVHGYNYRWTDYEPDHEKYPERVMIGTETFAMEALENFELAEKHPYVIGGFVWTGMDYFGESGIGHSRLDDTEFAMLPKGPWFNAYCGDIDILGNKKSQKFFRDVVWRQSNLEMLVHKPIPDGRKEIVSMWGWPDESKSWNWGGKEGHPLEVRVYSRCDQVRLELNGKVIGTQNIPKESAGVRKDQPFPQAQEIEALVAKFVVPYQPGILEAVGIIEGKEIVRETLKTTGKPSGISISAEQEVEQFMENDLAYFNVEVVDENGTWVPDAQVPIQFQIQGNAVLQAVANGNPTEMKNFQEPQVNSFRGKCQLILKWTAPKGEIKVQVKSEGLDSGDIFLRL